MCQKARDITSFTICNSKLLNMDATCEKSKTAEVEKKNINDVIP